MLGMNWLPHCALPEARSLLAGPLSRYAGYSIFWMYGLSGCPKGGLAGYSMLLGPQGFISIGPEPIGFGVGPVSRGGGAAGGLGVGPGVGGGGRRAGRPDVLGHDADRAGEVVEVRLGRLVERERHLVAGRGDVLQPGTGPQCIDVGG